jgi:myo-inositol-1(or 4)-monophosphatase
LPEPDISQKQADDLKVMRAAANAAGDIARKFFKTDLKQWDKGKNDPVSEADIAIDQYLQQTLLEARPEYGWLSEETEDDAARLTKSFVWVVDPIDGTRAFLKGKPHFTICIAVVKDGKPQTAVVFNPITQEFFHAIDGAGAYLNGEPIRVSQTKALENCLMLGDEGMFKHPFWERPWPEMQIDTRNSVAYRMVLVAAGQHDAMLALNWKSDWDLAAADLIVREAGGYSTLHTGAELIYNLSEAKHRSIVAAGPALHKRILDRIQHLKLP